MIVRRFWESLTDESCTDGDIDDHGILDADGEYVSLSGISGDAALSLLHRGSTVVDIDSSTHDDRRDDLRRTLEGLVSDIDGIDTIDGINLQGDGEILIYGRAGGATVDGRPYLRSFAVQLGADLYLDAIEMLEEMAR